MPISQWPTVSVVIPCRNAEPFIAHTLDTVLANHYPAEWEILVVEGRSDDRSLEICEDYAAKHPTIRVIDNPAKHLAAALNLATSEAKGEIFLRLDAHASCKSDYIRRSVESLIDNDADLVGPVLNIVPGDDSLVARCIAFVWSHPLGAGTAPYKKKWRSWKEPRQVPSAPYGCMRHSIFERLGIYDEDVPRSEDLDFNRRITSSGGRVLLDPNIAVEYHARRNLRELSLHALANGVMLTLPLMFHKRVFFWKHLTPFFLLLAMIFGSILGALVPDFEMLAPIGLLVYLMSVTAIAIGEGIKKRDFRCVVTIPVVFFVLHLGYGTGSFFGLVKALCSKTFWACWD